jgi:hypothetical protein
MLLLLCTYELRTAHNVSVREPERNLLEDAAVQYENRLHSLSGKCKDPLTMPVELVTKLAVH